MPRKPKEQAAAPIGRPSSYTSEMGDAICERLADGDSLRTICAAEEMPSKSTVFRWLADETNTAFRDQYALAREAQADAMVDDMLDIADDGSNDWMERKNADGENIGWTENGEAMRRSTLRVETRKWIAAKMRPKKYGDKIAVDGNMTHGVDGSVVALMDAINGTTRTLP